MINRDAIINKYQIPYLLKHEVEPDLGDVIKTVYFINERNKSNKRNNYSFYNYL